MTKPTPAAPAPVPQISFADQAYNPRLKINIAQQGYEHATVAQCHALPAALAGQDLLMSADTGSGKTLAYVIPALNQILNTLSSFKTLNKLNRHLPSRPTHSV